jgi:diguanylate cyclase (GGDEF)-like protein
MSETVRVMLERLVACTDAEGAAWLDAPDATGAATALYHAGEGIDQVLRVADAALRRDPRGAIDFSPDGRTILLSTGSGNGAFDASGIARVGAETSSRSGLALWRVKGHPSWSQADRQTASVAASMIRAVVAAEARRRFAQGLAGLDPLTGLMNRVAFVKEFARHLTRLERDFEVGTLLLIDIDQLRRVNDRLGRHVGDEVLMRAVELLRATFRPSDMMGRVGGDEFGVWMNGADHLTAAERAEEMRIGSRRQFASLLDSRAPAPTLSIGIVSRERDSDDDVTTLMQKASRAVHQVKSDGGSHWRVFHADAPA